MATDKGFFNYWVVANLSTARFHGAVGSGPSAASAFLSGGTPPATNATEEWTLARNVKTISA